MNIDYMPAGREMDKAISQHVFGDTEFVCRNCEDDYYTVDRQGLTAYIPVPHYSTDMVAAWEVVEKMPVPFKLEKRWEKTYQVGPLGWSACWCAEEICNGCYEGERCTNGNDIWADTAPLAICRAALKAMGVTEC